jgi:adenylate cyclase
MPIEIERKFLAGKGYKEAAFDQNEVAQGYLSAVPDRTVRIRIKGELGFITIKGRINSSGMSRYEWEKEIPLSEARELLLLCEPGVVEKTRYLVRSGKHVWEVDEFHGENDGLVMAEIELSSEDEPFVSPDWLGVEVTGDIRYHNSHLARYPYCKWQHG